MNTLDIKDLSKSFGSFTLNNISLSLPRGYILGYIGQNGAGKTTTIKLIMNQLKADSGEIKVCGRKFTDDEAGYKNIIGYIADECYFPSSFTLKDIASVCRDFYHTFSESKFRSYAAKWGLPDSKKVKDFSKGMKMKLMFAAVLSRDTELLLLDEPTSGLDPVMRSEVLELLQEYIGDGKRSVLFSTHIMSDLEKIADYLCLIENGQILFHDTKDNVLDRYFLVKGGLADLTQDLQSKLIGLKKFGVGFEGLIEVSDKAAVPKSVLTEKPSIDDIVVHHIAGVRR